MILPSILVTGVIPPKLPVTNASSGKHPKEKFLFTRDLLFHRLIDLPRVIPFIQYWPVEVHTSSSLMMKKLVALQVDTKPFISSISASSAPFTLEERLNFM